ncbi:hypothetical protein A3A48_00755 [Candidatus Curtissbacteria bacterium RIFCSPLOWO2_01_FULL_37_9]|uniref:Uncharacterized protein n=1 Tax=Candidatus Curtissbacteria bacterium RIFCSPLOWO2_01_FULL_37_9 TaxID=1797724 RepID=A0A1F5GUG7_9BACT|nr:MAG: hypothetical protein A3A48_00755 [Candidatus Curtissbacteria bacterium RIFCSPLOWO2_01_FULL_37_9]
MSDIALQQIKKILQVELKPVNKKLDEHSQKLDSLTLDMIDVQKKTDVLIDIQSYIEDTKEKVDDHEERIQRLENAV